MCVGGGWGGVQEELQGPGLFMEEAVTGAPSDVVLSVKKPQIKANTR